MCQWHSGLMLPAFFALASASAVYDYVIVGGGTAGLTIASRLTDDPSVTVAVIEAGINAEDMPEVFIPGLAIEGGSLATLNWAYPTVPQVNLNSRQVTVNAGKALGGSTVINAMIFPRAEKEQYDIWGALNNDPSWTWNGLLPFFKKSENATPPNPQQAAEGVRFDPSVHGFEGRVKVGWPNFFFEQYGVWLKTAENLGFRASPDLANGDPHAVGFSPNSMDAVNNTRCSAACAYYTPFSDRPNFTVILNATASRIIWEDRNSKLARATAVEYIASNGTTLQALVGKEVIVTAGTIGSPKFLELSGVGNATILAAAGVKQVVDLPTVGENLADHVHSSVTSFTTFNLTYNLLLNSTFLAEQEALWFTNRTGILSGINISSALGIAAPSDLFSQKELAVLLAQSKSTLQAYAVAFSNGNANLAKGIAKQLEAALSLYAKNKELPVELNLAPGYAGPTALTSLPAGSFTSVNNVLYAPLSRGRTHIVTSSPSDNPAIDPNYYAHPLDVSAHAASVQLARKMLTTPPLNDTFLGEFEPGSDKVTNEQIETYLRANVFSDNHETGSLSMMPRDIGGVVDTDLKVYGTANVRVADASIIPFPVSAHMSSTVYAIGEKAASIIQNTKTSP